MGLNELDRQPQPGGPAAGAAHGSTRRWRGKWIWEPDRVEGRVDRKLLFRRSFELGSRPASAALRVAGDCRYVVWINGSEVLRGPIRGNPHRLHYDEVEIAEDLLFGTNAIAVLARHYGVANPWWRPSPQTITLGRGAFVAELHLPEGVIGSDRSWKVCEGSAWTPGPPTWEPFGGADGTRTRPFFEEILDARLLPERWVEPGFDDSQWASAEEIVAVHPGGIREARPPSDPYGPLLPRPIPMLGGPQSAPWAMRVAPVGQAAELDSPNGTVRQSLGELAGPFEEQGGDAEMTLGPGCWAVVADFGEIVAGTLQLALEAAAGTVVDVAFAETADERGIPEVRQLGGLRYIARGHGDALEAIESCGGRYVVLIARGEAPISLTRLRMQRRSRPRLGSSRFACSDPALERIYEVGVHTVDLLAQDAYISDLAREQRAWMDFVIPQKVDLVSNEDWRLARWHSQLAASPRSDGIIPPAVAGDLEEANLSAVPDWSLHWIHTVYNLFRYTGDRELISDLMPVAERVLRWFTAYQADDGLLVDVDGHPLIDWAAIYTKGCSSALNALWARGLREFEEMASWLGDAGRTEWARRTRLQIGESLRWLWDDARGGYVDHAVDGSPQRTLSVHATAAAVCAEILPSRWAAPALALLTDEERLLRRSFMFSATAPAGVREVLLYGPPEPDWDVEETVIDAEPFYRYVVHEAVARLGRPDLVGAMCRDWQVFVDAGETAWPETWHGGSHCHGWSATPTFDLVAFTAGITPAAPGYERVRVAPALGDLDWVEAQVPSPHGPIFARADRQSITVESPVPIELVDPSDGHLHRKEPGRHVVELSSPG